MPRQITVQGRPAWCKFYAAPPRSRRIATRLWNRLTDRLDVWPLRSPPRHADDQAKQLEMRRIRQLQAHGIRVPEILGEGRQVLLLSDLGPSLSSCLKRANGPDQVDTLVHRAVAAIVAAHRRGAYFGQAFARNITVDDSEIGFIDFEEDPLEVMSLPEAQARDWLLFSAGVARYYEGRTHVLSELLGEGLPRVANEVSREIHHATRRLGFLENGTRYLGQRARALGAAVISLDKSVKVMLLAVVLLVDFVSDGDSDILQALSSLL